MLDLEGLQVAFLGVALAHYLDVESGDIIDIPLDASPPGPYPRFRRIPTRTTETETADRMLFVEGLAPSPVRERLARAAGDATAFRQALMDDRTVEKKWFHFKNDQATAAIAQWLDAEGLA